MLLNKKGDVEEIEFAGKYGKVFESIHDFLDPEPAEWTKVEKEADGTGTGRTDPCRGAGIF